MSAYKPLLKTEDTLDNLQARMSHPKEFEDLIRDILKENLQLLEEFDYIENSRTSSAFSEAVNWLLNAPLFIQRASFSVFDKLFEEAVRLKDWVFVGRILAITNSHKSGVSEKMLKYIIQKYAIPEITEIKIHLTLLSLQRNNPNPNKPFSFPFWNNLINIPEKPHLAVVLMSVYKNSKPMKAAGYLTRLEKYMPEIPAPDVRLIFQTQMSQIIIKQLNRDVSDEKFEGVVDEFIKWCYTLEVQWIQHLVVDALQLKRLKDLIQDAIKSNEEFLAVIRFLERGKKPVEKTIEELQYNLQDLELPIGESLALEI